MTDPAGQRIVTDALLGVGDGVQRVYTPREGAGARIESVYREDWQGRQLLYPVPRTNQDANSNDGGAWIAGLNHSTAASDKTFAGRIPYTEIIRQATTASSPVERLGPAPALTAPTRAIWTLAVRAGTSDKIDIGLYQAALNPDHSWGDPGTFGSRIISGPGSINQVNPEQLRGLSPDEDTVIEIWRDYIVGDRIDALIYIGSRNGTAVIGDSNLVTRSMITYGQAQQGAYIETDGAQRTVTDYTLAGPTVRLAETPEKNARLTWSGRAVYTPQPTLLPPSSVPAQRAVDAAIAQRLNSVPVPLRPLRNPATCPEALLPWLAWELSIDAWKSYWPIDIKRARVAAALDIQRRKGTAQSVRDVIASFGGGVVITEWWQQSPRGVPRTFNLQLSLRGQGGQEVTAEFVDDVIAEVSRTKPVGSHFSFTQQSVFAGGVGVAALARPCLYARLTLHAPGA
jgi:phage tail P2-like protein